MVMVFALQSVLVVVVTAVFLSQMPKMEFRSNAKPSLYAYPPMLKKEKETAKEKVTNPPAVV